MGSLSGGGFCQGVSVRELSVQGVFVQGVSIQGGLCPGGSLSRKLLPCPKLRLRALKIFHSFGHVSTNPATLKLLNHTRHQWLIQDFPEKEGPTPKEHANILFGQNFPKKLHENDKNWTEKGTGGSPKFY